MVTYTPTFVPSGTNCSTNGLAKAIGSVSCTSDIQESRSPGVVSGRLFSLNTITMECMHDMNHEDVRKNLELFMHITRPCNYTQLTTAQTLNIVHQK